MKTIITWMFTITLCMFTHFTFASELKEQIIGCWKSEKSANVICYKEGGDLYVNQSNGTEYGKWYIDNNSTLILSIGMIKINLDVLNINNKAVTYKSIAKTRTDHRVPNQPPGSIKKHVVKNSKLDSKKVDVVKDITNIVTKKKSKNINRLGNDLVVNTAHCKTENNTYFSAEVTSALKNNGFANSDALVDSFLSLICQGKSQSNSKVTTDSPFLASSAFYSGYKMLGDWSCDGQAKQSQSVSFHGIFNNPNQVSRWQKKSDNEITIWLAGFKMAPSDANAFSMEYKDKQWHLKSVCYSTRL